MVVITPGNKRAPIRRKRSISKRLAGTTEDLDGPADPGAGRFDHQEASKAVLPTEPQGP